MEDREILLTKPLYKRDGAEENEIFTPLDKLVPGATAALLEFKERCDADPSRFDGAFFQGLTHGDLNWKNILKDQSDKIWIIGTSMKGERKCTRVCACVVWTRVCVLGTARGRDPPEAEHAVLKRTRVFS